MIQIGTSIEGHPDNIVSAIMGGMNVSVYDDKSQVIHSKISLAENLRFAFFIPDFSLSTSSARQVMPQNYGLEDCIFNIGRAAMLVAAMNNGETEKLRFATKDRIHQPYRGKLLPGIERIFKAAQSLGSKAEMISGSGPTLLAIIDKQNTDFKVSMDNMLKNLEMNWETIVLRPDLEGAKYYLR